jgi:hypothetical protein
VEEIKDTLIPKVISEIRGDTEEVGLDIGVTLGGVPIEVPPDGVCVCGGAAGFLVFYL